MLNQILMLLDTGNALSLEDICEKTGASKDSVKAQIEFLERAGYLKSIELPHVQKTNCSDCKKDCNFQMKSTCFPCVWEKTKV